jgi:uncharacterized protein YlxW (UPF0749 family)
MKSNSRYLLFLAFLILGIIASVQFKSNFYKNKQNSESKYQVDQLRAMLNEEQEAINKLKSAIAENEKVRETHLKSAVNNANNDFLKWQHKYLDEVRQKAGFMDVQGPGIIIKLDDAPARKNYPTWRLIIHDSDVKNIVNELKFAGAQAMSINGERLLATSEQVCAGPTILINKNRYPVPYVIKVIGNPDVLYKKFDESNTVALMRQDGIRINIEKSKEVLIPKYAHKLENLIEGLEAVN